MHNKHAPILICLRTTIQIFVPKVAIRRPSRINGSFLIPKHLYIINNIKALASCTTSVYVNLSKNSFFNTIAQKLRESGCKGTAFFRTNKTFPGKFSVFECTFSTS